MAVARNALFLLLSLCCILAQGNETDRWELTISRSQNAIVPNQINLRGIENYTPNSLGEFGDQGILTWNALTPYTERALYQPVPMVDIIDTCVSPTIEPVGLVDLGKESRAESDAQAILAQAFPDIFSSPESKFLIDLQKIKICDGMTRPSKVILREILNFIETELKTCSLEGCTDTIYWREIQHLVSYTTAIIKRILDLPELHDNLCEIAFILSSIEQVGANLQYQEVIGKLTLLKPDALYYFVEDKLLSIAGLLNSVEEQVLKVNTNASKHKRDLESLTVPCEWECPAFFYDANDGCDCNCGPVEDPDCILSTDLVYGCEEYELFNECSEGQCVGEPKEVPDGWSCSRSYYNANDGCDCQCGAHDPDCDAGFDPNVAPEDFLIYGCPVTNSFICNQGNCWYRYIPTEWTCTPSAYGTNDGCNCECGAIDPDCSNSTLSVYNCPCAGMSCTLGFCSGVCEDRILQVSSSKKSSFIPPTQTTTMYSKSDANRNKIIAPELKFEGRRSLLTKQVAISRSKKTKRSTCSIPFEWSCPASFYNSNDGCDCECGAWDPDCDISTSNEELFGCYGYINECFNSPSEGGKCLTIQDRPVESWYCDPSYYDANDGCDCGCGAPDPDCNDPTQLTYGCYQAGNIGCKSDGNCNWPIAPVGWKCQDYHYATNDGCDCNCGIIDPDCLIPGIVTVYNCGCDAMQCDSGYCEGECGSVLITVNFSNTTQISASFSPLPIGTTSPSPPASKTPSPTPIIAATQSTSQISVDPTSEQSQEQSVDHSTRNSSQKDDKNYSVRLDSSNLFTHFILIFTFVNVFLQW